MRGCASLAGSHAVCVAQPRCRGFILLCVRACVRVCVCVCVCVWLSAASVQRGHAWRRLGEYEAALRDYTDALESLPRNTKLYNNR